MPFKEGNIELSAKEAETCWGEAYPTVIRIIEENHLEVGAEIGVAYGGLCESILANTEVKKVYGVDPYLCKYSCQGLFQLTQDELDSLHDSVLSRLEKHAKKFQLIREPSHEASKYVREQLDFVYIDADHTYQGAMTDLITWYPRIRNGGFLAGHDYNHPNWPGVTKAVNRFFRFMRSTVNSEGYVWWIRKRHTRMESILLRLISIYLRVRMKQYT